MSRKHNNVQRVWRLSRSLAAAIVTLLIGVAATAPSASAEFGLQAFDGAIEASPAGNPFTQAGGHPYQLSTRIEVNNHIAVFRFPDADVKDVLAEVPPGLMANPTPFAQCNMAELANTGVSASTKDWCPLAAQVGVIYLDLGIVNLPLPLFNMEPPSGVAARFGFSVAGVTVAIDGGARGAGSGFHLSVDSRNISQGLALSAMKPVFWGVPADPKHDGDRCWSPSPSDAPSELCTGEPGDDFEAGDPHSMGAPPIPFLTLPTRCTAPEEGLRFDLAIDSWEEPGVFHYGHYLTHDPPGLPGPGPERGTEGCIRVPFDPSIEVLPSSHSAETATGLGVKLEFPTDGLLNPTGVAQSQMKKATVTLPEGVTVNPSSAEGLGVCTAAQFAEESLGSSLSEGCSSTSKIGTVQIKTPLLSEPVDGTLYIAQPDDPTTTTPGAENPFDSLLALYIVVRNTERGIFIKLPGKVEPDPSTGQIITTFDDLPQASIESFELKFRESARGVLITPPACGTYETEADFVPWSDTSETIHTTSSFEIEDGVGAGPCPSKGVPPFKPGFEAGSINNNAKSFSPFDMRLTRRDGEQDMTKFSTVLPPGVLGKLAGLSKCPASAVAIAKAKTATEEIANPSCPANSEIGRSLAGAGVGSVLTYVGGKVYLGGPLNGDPLSVIAITPAKAGPFDVGTVVVQEALNLNPKTAEVEVDGANSEPIPHILAGIPLKLRDLRVYVDRPDFILNPTSCEESKTKATLFGSFLDVFSPADDKPVGLSDRYQAANCANLGFKPNLQLQLKGGTKRGGHPGLKATYSPRKGDANLKGLVVRLPSSAFLDQAHIRTICTRVQFAAKNCPKAAQYGFIKATTPLLDEPLEGPVYLRSSNHKLPDLIFDLHGLVDVEVATRIDSVHGGIRATVEEAPDAPLTKVLLRMQGAKKGLIVNSRNLCASTNRAKVLFSGQNGKQASARPVMGAGCGKKHKHGRLQPG